MKKMWDIVVNVTLLKSTIYERTNPITNIDTIQAENHRFNPTHAW
jgi:hypothetical protein